MRSIRVTCERQLLSQAELAVFNYDICQFSLTAGCVYTETENYITPNNWRLGIYFFFSLEHRPHRNMLKNKCRKRQRFWRYSIRAIVENVTQKQWQRTITIAHESDMPILEHKNADSVKQIATGLCHYSCKYHMHMWEAEFHYYVRLFFLVHNSRWFRLMVRQMNALRIEQTQSRSHNIFNSLEQSLADHLKFCFGYIYSEAKFVEISMTIPQCFFAQAEPDQQLVKLNEKNAIQIFAQLIRTTKENI